MRRYIRANEISGGSVTLKNMNTDVIPVADFGTYWGALNSLLEDVFVAWGVNLDNYGTDNEYYDEVVQLIDEDYDGTDEFFAQVLRYAPSTIQDAFNEYGIPATVVGGSCKWYHPREYNFGDDVIEFDMTIDTTWVEDKFREFSNEPEFQKYLKDNFSSRSGFWSWMPDNTTGYEEILDPADKDYWKLVSAIIGYIVGQDTSIRDDVTMDLYESIIENPDYATFSSYEIY